MTIEKLEALERAKDDPTCTADEFVERCTRLAQAQQAAFPHLLAVAKAAKAFDCAMQSCDPHEIGVAQRGIRAALSRLEAQ